MSIMSNRENIKIEIIRRHSRLLKYLVSGGSAFGVEYLTFLLLFYVLTHNIVISNALSYTAGFVVSFWLNRNWVFRSSNHQYRLSYQAVMYLILGGVNLILSTLAIKIIHAYIPAYAAKLLTVVVIAAWNFVVYRNFLFKERVAGP